MDLSLHDSTFVVRLAPMEQLWAFRFGKPIEIPLRSITRVSTETPQFEWWHIRAPGTYLPGVIKAGTYYNRRGREFWYARPNRGFLVLELEGERYKRVVLTPDDAANWAEKLESARMG